MPDTAHYIRFALAAGSAGHALELVLAAARRAGESVLEGRQVLLARQGFALPLQAADEDLVAMAVELAGGTNGKE
jgi:hypothetical protein